jgi:hypothetical protein
VAWVAQSAELRVEIREGQPPRLDATYRFERVADGWLDARLAGPGLVAEVADLGVGGGPDGLRLVLGPDRDGATVHFTGWLADAATDHAALAILPAARQHVTVDAPGLDVAVEGALDGWINHGDRLAFSWAPARTEPPLAPRPVVLGETAVAAWGSEGALAVHAAVRWRVRRGEVSRLRLDVADLDEVEISGANVAKWSREGDVVVIETREAVRGLIAVDVRGRRPLGAEAAEVPAVRPLNVLRDDRYWILGKSDEGELIPTSAASVVPARSLPPWARGLSEAAPVAYWHGAAPLVLVASRYDPLSGPDTVVERAEFVVSTSEEGRALLRATFRVRNESRQYLHVRPAPGWKPVAAQVGGVPVTVLSDGASGLYVPMEKSIETVRGLLNFTVELTWIGVGDRWVRRGSRTLALPAVDAPIQQARWEVHLPSRKAALGRYAGTTAPLVDARKVAAESAWQNAVTAYKGNRFTEAQQWLDTARDYAPADEDVERLQSNLDVLLDGRTDRDGRAEGDEAGKADASEDLASRRVRELAHAKTGRVQQEQEEVERRAEEAIRSGDYEAAEGYLEAATSLATELGRTEQKESVVQSDKLAQAARSLTTVRRELVKKKEKSERKPADGQLVEPTELSITGTGEGGGGYAASGEAYGSGSLGTTTVLPPPPPPEPPPEIYFEAPEPMPAPVTAGGASRAPPLGGLFRGPAKAPAPATVDAPPVATGGERTFGPVGAAPEAPSAAPAPAVPKPAARAPLQAQASPITLALPLAGPAVWAEQALLDADTFPNLTVRFRTLPGEYR